MWNNTTQSKKKKQQFYLFQNPIYSFRCDVLWTVSVAKLQMRKYT